MYVDARCPLVPGKNISAMGTIPDCAVIAAHQVCHAVMQGNVMLVVAFGISDVEYPVSHIHIRTFQQPCFSSTYAAAVKKPEEYRNRDAPDEYVSCFWDVRQIITGFEKTAYLIPREGIRDISHTFLPWYPGRQNLRKPPF